MNYLHGLKLNLYLAKNKPFTGANNMSLDTNNKKANSFN